MIASIPTAIHVADGQVEEVGGCSEGQYKAKAVFTVREVASGDAVSGATVSVAVVATCDGVTGSTESLIAVTGADGKATLTMSSCVGCGNPFDLEITFTVTGVVSPDERPYEAGANLCNKAVWRLNCCEED